MDDQGYLSVEGVHAISRDVFADDQAKMEKAIEFTEACKSGWYSINQIIFVGICLQMKLKQYVKQVGIFKVIFFFSDLLLDY